MNHYISAAEHIFKKYYECMIPQFHLYSKEEVETFGVPTTGDPIIDKGSANRLTHVRLTIDRMAEIHAEGSPIALLHPEESLEICNTIYQHLNDWFNHVEHSMGASSPPVEELKKLESFAILLEEKARFYSDQPQTHIARNIQNLESTSHFNTSSEKVITQLKEEKQLKEHGIMDKAKESPKKEVKEKSNRFITDLIDQEVFQKRHSWR